MGYRMSQQRSLGGYSPYFLLFGRWPIVGASVRDVLQKVVDLDSPEDSGAACQRACQGGSMVRCTILCLIGTERYNSQVFEYSESRPGHCSNAKSSTIEAFSIFQNET
jgi:hypothetical protein